LRAAEGYDVTLLPVVLGSAGKRVNVLIVQQTKWISPMPGKLKYTTGFICTEDKTLCPKFIWNGNSRPQKQGEIIHGGIPEERPTLHVYCHSYYYIRELSHLIAATVSLVKLEGREMYKKNMKEKSEHGGGMEGSVKIKIGRSVGADADLGNLWEVGTNGPTGLPSLMYAQ
jgi:hypothetical protein